MVSIMTQITARPCLRSPEGKEETTVRLGIQFTRYPGMEELPLLDSLRQALEDGFTLVVLNSIDAELSGAAEDHLDEVAAEAGRAGVELQLGLGCAGPAGDPGTVRTDLRRALERGLELGMKEFFVHTRSERGGLMEQGRLLDHPAQLRLVRANLESLTAPAREAGIRINVKTHEDLASAEVLALVQDLDPAVFSIGLDVANLVVRGEDPQEVTRKLGPYIRMTHLEDVVLFPVLHGYRRRLRALGEGVLDWDELLGSLLASGVRDFTLEQHRGKFDTPVFDRSWFRYEPHLDAPELGQLARLGVLTHDGVARGDIPGLADWDEDPSPAERRRQLLHSAAALRRILTSSGAGIDRPATILSGEEGLS
jgi:sugar phosphate isomerase/epimerase